ncbi:MAG: hypothetical protein AB1304_02910 [Bacteroidota bacterium]
MGKLKDLFKKLGEGAKKAVNTLKDLGEKAVNGLKEAALFTAFLPLRPIAVAYLKRRGHNVNLLTKPSELIRLVYEAMRKKSYGLDGPQDVFDYSIEDFGWSLDSFSAIDKQAESYGFTPTPEMITAVIQFLKSIFDKIKEKKQNDEPLSEDEKSIDSQAAQIDAELTNAKAAAQELLAAEKSGGSTDMKKYLLIGVVAIVVILLIVFLVKRK